MNPALALKQQSDRFYPLIDHPVQLKLVQAIQDGLRIIVVPAGRRSGKTERAKRFMAKIAMTTPNKTYFLAAPTHGQAKKIWWNDMLLMTGPAHSKSPSISEQIIYLLNGSEIHVIGLDKPQRIEGQLWHGGIIDEIADIKSDAWEANIFPALNTMNPQEPDYKAWCWLIGVPDGLNHYYELNEQALSDKFPDWGSFHWISADILPSEVIEEAKRTMSPTQYKQEFEASFETATGRIYSSYSEDNYTNETIKDHEQLCWFHDFNYTPMSSGIGVIREKEIKHKGGRISQKKEIFLLDEIILKSADSTMTTLEFCDKYKNHKNKSLIIYGDPAGKNGEKHNLRSEYTQIEKVLKSHGWRFVRRVRPRTKSIRARQNAVRAQIKNANNEVSLFVNVDKCPYTHKGLSTTTLKEGSSFLEHEDDYQHITTAIGYFIEYEFPIKKEYDNVTEIPARWGHR